MKRMFKITAAVLCLMFAAVFTGCAAKAGPGASASASAKAADPGKDPTKIIVATVNGENIYRSDFDAYCDQAIQNELDYSGQMPYDESDEQAAKTYKETLLDEMVTNKLVDQKVKELGFDKLTDAQTAEAKQNADDDLQGIKDSIRSDVENPADGSPAPTSSADLDAQVQTQYTDWLKSQSLTEEQLKEQNLQYYLLQAKYGALIESVTSKATVTDAEIQKYYDENLKIQQDQIKDDPSQYDVHKVEDVVLYVPEGIVKVKQILIKVKDDKSATAQELYGQDKVEEAFDVLAKEFARIQPKAEEVLKKVNAKADFDKLIEQYNEGDVMKNEPEKTEGMVVVPGSTDPFKEFTDAAMNLKNPGDTSGLVKTVEGYNILKNVGTIAPGPVPLASVKDQIREILLSPNQENAWNNQIAAWKEEAKDNIKTYKDNLYVEVETPQESAPAEASPAPSAS